MTSLGTTEEEKGSETTSGWREPVLVTLGASGAIALFSWLPLLLPFLEPYASALIAAAFIYLPALVIWRRGGHLGQIGLVPPDRLTLRVTGVVLVIVFPLFCAGFFAYHHLFFERTPCATVQRLPAWPEALYPSPYSGLRTGLVLAKDDSEDLILRQNLPGEVTVSARFEPADMLVWHETGTGRSRPLEGGALVERMEPGDALRFRVRSGQGKVEIVSAGKVQTLWYGNREERDLPVSETCDLTWLWSFLLIQVLLVALPEELFYRGYLQTRLRQLLGRRFVLFGGDVGPAVLISSAVFAVGHVLSIPSPTRLAVFFPSLLFGWLRDRTGGLTAPIAVHVLSNLLLAVLTRFLC
ncbi:MAG: CPBP family intramembrane metalloprotease [Deltaproteobacteria bacterium]|nr:CPBP family intramembrane metalloprotease [Deltaproteobacteria bacterium]